jgi:hypothetical protein
LRKNNLTPAELVAIVTNFANEISDLKTSEDDEDEFAHMRDVLEMSDAEDHISEFEEETDEFSGDSKTQIEASAAKSGHEWISRPLTMTRRLVTTS